MLACLSIYPPVLLSACLACSKPMSTLPHSMRRVTTRSDRERSPASGACSGAKGSERPFPRMSIEGELPREGESEDRRAQQVLNIQWAMLGIHLCLGHCIVAVC